jgi:hypothetical protein
MFPEEKTGRRKGVLILNLEDGSETFLRNVSLHMGTRRYIPQDGNTHIYRCKNLESCIIYIYIS